MTNQQAQFVLHAYRPNGADASDPIFGEALDQARRDPALGQWFGAQQRFDRAVAGKLGSAQVPAGLRESILAGARAGGAETAAKPPARPAWRFTAWLALAASVAVVSAVGLALWPKEVSAKEALMDFAIADLRRADHEGKHGPKTSEFQALVSLTDTRLGRGVAVDFERLQRDGCRTVTFGGRELLEVCFERDGQWFHCYVARKKDFPNFAARLAPVFRAADGITAGAWSDGEHIFVVATEAGRAALERLI